MCWVPSSRAALALFQALDFAGVEGGLDFGHEAGDGLAGGGVDGVAQLIERGADGGEHLGGLEAGLGEDALAHVVEGVLDDSRRSFSRRPRRRHRRRS